MEDWTSCHIFLVRVGICGVLSYLWLRDLFACTDNLMLLGKNLYSPISGKWLLEVAASCCEIDCLSHADLDHANHKSLEKNVYALTSWQAFAAKWNQSQRGCCTRNILVIALVTWKLPPLHGRWKFVCKHLPSTLYAVVKKVQRKSETENLPL